MSENINYGAETVEEYAELLNTPVEIPRTSKRVFKGANIEKIDALLRDPVMIDLEKLGFNGDLDDEALLDYCIQLPEFRDVCRRFDEALAETFAFMKKTIPSVVKNRFNPMVHFVMQV